MCIVYAVMKDGVLVGKFATSVFAEVVAAHAGAVLLNCGPASGVMESNLVWEPVLPAPEGSQIFRAYAPEGYFQLPAL